MGVSVNNRGPEPRPWPATRNVALRPVPASSTSRTVGTATAFVLVLMAVVRMVAWTIGDYASWLGDIPRQEATALLGIALALVVIIIFLFLGSFRAVLIPTVAVPVSVVTTPSP